MESIDLNDAANNHRKKIIKSKKIVSKKTYSVGPTHLNNNIQ